MANWGASARRPRDRSLIRGGSHNGVGEPGFLQTIDLSPRSFFVAADLIEDCLGLTKKASQAG
jgi:hypothetical protein